LTAWLCDVSIAKELDERIRFSVRPISETQGMLLMILTLVACASLYLGYAAHVEREGFSVPESYIEMFMQQMEKQIETRVPVAERQEAVARFREEFHRTVDEFLKHTVKPYEQFIVLGIAASIFMSLLTITRVLAWVPTVVLNLVFPLLGVLGVTKVVCEMKEQQRLVIS
jgi:hypothetical protein